MVILLLLLTMSLYGAEVDNFSQRHISLPDSLNLLNTLTNDSLNEALKKTKQCREDHLYETLRQHFHKLAQKTLSDQIMKSNRLGFNKIRTPFKKSVYQDFNFSDGFILTSFKSFSLAELIQVDGVYLGMDKLRHFWGKGHHYFKLYSLNQGPLDDALKYGWNEENSFLGFWTTGVVSYADLSANFHGMRFWNHILQKKEDIFGQNLGPYVECQNGRWAQVKQMDFANYVDQSFDESINCSVFRNERILKKIQNRMRILSEEGNIELTCPMESIDSLKDQYGDLAPYLLNFHGHQSQDNPEFKALHPYPLTQSET